MATPFASFTIAHYRYFLQSALESGCEFILFPELPWDMHDLSDSNTVWTKGSPIELFQACKHRRLQLLLHPEWRTTEG